jgi:hypothetical protein
MTTFAQHSAAFESFLDCVQGGAGKDAIAGCLAENVVLIGPLSDEPLTGREAVALYDSVVPVVAGYGDALAGKAIIDISNPFNSEGDGLAIREDTSIAQEAAKAAPASASVFKAFNTIFRHVLEKGRPLGVLIAGDNAEAKADALVFSSGSANRGWPRPGSTPGQQRVHHRARHSARPGLPDPSQRRAAKRAQRGAQRSVGDGHHGNRYQNPRPVHT